MCAAPVRPSDGASEMFSCDASRDSQPLSLAVSGGNANTRSSSTNEQSKLQPDLDAIRRELEELKQRREQLERQRKELLEGKYKHTEGPRGRCISSRASTHAGIGMSHSASGLTLAHIRSEVGLLTADAGVNAAHESHSRSSYRDSLVLSNMKTIPSEKERRRLLKATPHLAAKDALRTAAQHDSTLLMGSFLLEDNPHTCTFARERRFRPLLGQKGKYFLSSDLAIDQCINRNHPNATTALNAFESSSQTPGPGAYTPRYSKLSRPPRAY
ncbi:hypothetical protein, conserved [Leishmania tarentolae]|uniref:Uncharacterized protein n=1 Tax=Leishmania tarentolae TaxID=5689 RepID=A0A640KTV2_LEITA|nr:hypothetical protein, conserved [Leishmania tarentolae]